MRRHLTTVVVSLVLAAGLLAGCSSGRTGQGTVDESCYLALPTAAEAVGPHAHLAGVVRFTVAGLKGPAPHVYEHLQAEGLSAKQAVCLVAYTGRFSADRVAKAYGHASGPLAVVAVKTPGSELLGTLILTHIPVRFEHTHPF